MSTPKDKLDFIVNPFTGELDAISKFNPDRIVTNTLNAAGNPRMIYDFQSGLWIEDSAAIVVDNSGKVVVV